MKLYQNFSNEFEKYATPSDIIEFLYCKRFTYFMKCLGISQNEEKRYKVLVGRDIHKKRMIRNKEYLRKKINCTDKRINVHLISKEYNIRGIVDEVVTLEDKTMAPLDYKFSRYDEKLYNTYKIQIVMYALMIKEVFGFEVNAGYIVYVREGNRIVKIDIDDKERKKVVDILKQYNEVCRGYFPHVKSNKKKCFDCCYRNICIK